MVAIVVISGLGLLSIAAVHTGLAEPLIDSIREAAGGIEWPQWVPFGPSDTTPPTIVALEVTDKSDTGAVISWQTDEPTTSELHLCDLTDPSGQCALIEPEETPDAVHSITLAKLNPGTSYQLTVISMDAAGNKAEQETEFTTPGEAGTTPPVISAVAVSDRGESSASVGWETEEPATSQVEYGTTSAYGSTTPLDKELTTNHSVTLTGLEPNTTYHFRMKSKDATGNEATSSDAAFQTEPASPPAPIPTIAEKDKPAPDFTLQKVKVEDGASVTLHEFQGKLVIVNFRTIDCDVKGNELYTLKAVCDDWPPDDLVVLAVFFGDSAGDVRDFVAGKDLPFPVLVDSPVKYAGPEYYNVISRPTSFFIDREGIVRIVNKLRLDDAKQVKCVLSSL